MTANDDKPGFFSFKGHFTVGAICASLVAPLLSSAAVSVYEALRDGLAVSVPVEHDGPPTDGEAVPDREGDNATVAWLGRMCALITVAFVAFIPSFSFFTSLFKARRYGERMSFFNARNPDYEPVKYRVIMSVSFLISFFLTCFACVLFLYFWSD